MTVRTEQIEVGGTIALPNAIIGSDGAAAYGQGLTVQDAGVDTGCLLYSNIAMYAFAGSLAAERTGMIYEFANQVSIYYNNARAAYFNGSGLNLQERSLSEWKHGISNKIADGVLATQATGGISTNIGAAGTVTMMLPSTPSVGHHYTFYRVDNFAFRIQPFAGTATGTITNATNFLDTETVTIDAKVYTFQTSLTNVDGNVQIGGTVALSHANLRGATAMSLHPTVSATDTATTTDLTAKTAGTGGNSIALVENTATATVSAATLLGGTASVSAIIVAAGKQADGNYVELGAVGSSIKLVINSQGDWMAVYENGTITPE
jgi:hypothetical protein